MGRFDAYCTYHQRKGHVTIFCKSLEKAILDLIAQGKYQIDDTTSNPSHTVNTITIDKEVFARLRRVHLYHVPNSITIEQVSVPLDPKAYNMI